MTCITEVCALIAWGYAAEVQQSAKADTTLQKYAIFRTDDRCNGNITDPSFTSACVDIGKPEDYLWVECPSGKMRCHKIYGKPNSMPAPLPVSLTPNDRQQLPPVTVTKPIVPRHGNRKVATAGGGTGQGQGKGKAEPTPPIAAQIATQLARQGGIYGAQMLGTAAMSWTGPAAPFVGPWVGCAVMRYQYLRHDFAVMERWDLHPEIDRNNQLYVIKMCSPIGFLFRMQEAQTPFEKVTALMGGLTYVADPWVNLLGQLAPASPSVVSNIKTIGTALSVKQGKFKKQPKQPLYKEAWMAHTP